MVRSLRRWRVRRTRTNDGQLRGGLIGCGVRDNVDRADRDSSDRAGLVTRAPDGSALVHVTRTFESGFPLTSVTAERNLSVLRTDTCAVPGLTVTQFGAGGVFDTVTNADTRSLPDATVICALPRVCARTVPSLSTDAIVESLLLHCWG